MFGIRRTVESTLGQPAQNSSVLANIGSVRFATTAILAALTFGAVAATGQVNVTTYHNDIGRTGQNLNETILNTTNVNPTLFGKLFALPVDGQVYAEPLYMSGITVNGATHNVVFVATENDSVYAFDADSNGGTNASPLWKASMLSSAYGAAAGATTVPSSDVGTDINPQIGITGTPVIDPTTNTLYVVSKTVEVVAGVTTFPQRLHALDITTGAEKFGGPVVITAQVSGTGNGSVNGTLTFDSLWENQRPGLLLLNGIVWIGFAAHGDNGPWHGWILGYNASTLTQTGAFCATPNGGGAGFWMSGQGLAADQLDPVNLPFGRMFVPTGNGDYTATKPYTNNMDYGDSHLAIDLTKGVPTVTDEFTTNQQAALNSEDGDIASGGMMVIPTQTTGPYPHLAVQAGKMGYMYLLNRDNMGGYNTTADQIVQEQPYIVGVNGAWSSPAYWNGTVYWWGRNDTLKAFPLVNGLLATKPTTSSVTLFYPGATPSISANGTSQGLVWAIDSYGYASNSPAVLWAHNASNIATPLYSSSTNSARDTAGVAVKFVVPTVANGKVYVGTSTEVDVYGLLNGVTQTASPVITPGSETYANSVTVTITDPTPGSSIFYTTNGTPATASSTLYTGPFAITSTATVNAIATATGLLTSAQTSATYTNSSQASVVVFSEPTGTYTTAQSVTLSDTTAGSSIYYTTDGSTPTTASTPYTAPISVGATETITAIATAPGLSASQPLAQTFTITLGATGIDFTQGFAASTGLVILNGYAQLNDSRLQLTDGNSGEASTAWYHTPVSVQTFTTDFTFQLSNPVADGMTFAIQNSSAGTAAKGGNGQNLGYAPIANSIAIKFDLYSNAGEGPDSTGLYLNGAVPTVPAIDLSATGINLHSDDDMAVHLTYDGTTLSMTITDMVTAATWSTSWTINIPSTIGSNTAYVGFTGGTGGSSASQKILTWSYFTTPGTPTAATPTFSPAAGTYTSAQTVTISDTTAGATIYYTTNGTTPTTTTSSVYSGPITVAATETVQALAVASGYTNSAVGSAAYTINLTAATPTFSPSAGTYSSAQTVTISDATAGAVLYYTTNGATPTVSSSVYSGPISVAATETVKALAVAPGYTNSAVGSAAYTISTTAATPTFSPAAGTYTSAQTITISDTTPGAVIYYTTNGATPTVSSSGIYSGPISVGTTETVKAIAAAPGFTNSAVGSAAYTINLTAATPTFSPGAGTYTAAQTVTISDTTPGAVIYYTTNGSTPTSGSSGVYSGPVSVGASETLKAIAVQTGYANSAVGSAAYSISIPAAATPAFSPAAGSYNAIQTVTLTDATAGASIYYTLDGSTPTTASTLYTAPITVGVTETVTAIAVAPGMTASQPLAQAYTIVIGGTGISFTSGFTGSTGQMNLNGYSVLNGSAIQLTAASPGQASSAWYHTPVNIQTFTTDFTFQQASATADGMTFAIQNASPTAVGGNGSSLGYAPIANSLAIKFDLYSNAGEGSDSTGLYLNGALPTVPATDLSTTGINFRSGDVMAVHLTYDGATLSMTITDKVTAAAWSTSWPINIPTTIGSNTAYVGFTGATGGSTAIQSVLTWSYFTTSGTPTASTPTFSPATGTYTSAQNVTISDTTAGATIYYTTNGTTPTTSSSVYSAPVAVSTTETLNAIAVASGYTNSAPGSAAYTLNLTAATPTFSPAAGTYTTAQSVAISDTTAGATIYYTTNGTTPTTASSVYTGAISVGATETLKALAVATGYTNSAVGSAAYTINLGATATPTFSPVAGTYTSAQTVAISDTTAGATIYYTTNGTTPTTASTVYSTPITVSATETLKALAVATGFTNSAVGSAAYTINLPAATPTFSVAAGTYTSVQAVTISDITAGATIYYTTNGTTPTTASTVYTTAISVGTTETLKAIAAATGFSTSAVGSAAYTINLPAATTPTFSPVAGTYTSAQTVAISDTTAGATIYYTTNGTTPTTASTVYSTAISVGATETLKAIATATGFSSSAVGSAAYTINLPAATPTFSPVAGAYASAQTVTISDATAGAIIYYTTNGTTPTTASTVYTTAISVGTTGTLNAIAVATGSSTSAVGSAAYSISPLTPPPTFSLPAGAYNYAPSIALADTAAGATIYYTTNGTAPTTSSTVYSSPIAIKSAKTIQAIAVASGLGASTVASASYTLVVSDPVASPAGGSYSGSVTVTLATATPNATIYYSTNGLIPTTSSTIYSGPIVVSTTETLKTIAAETGFTTSATVANTYTVAAAAATPTFSPVSGTYASPQSVSITDATSGSTIYYTTDGSTPTAASTAYSGPIAVSTTETLNAIAVASGVSPSAVGSAAYTISAATPAINYASAFTATNLNMYGATITNGALQLTDGGGGENRMAWYLKPVSVQAFTTDFNFQDTSAVADGFTFVVQNSSSGVWALGGGGANLGYSGIGSSVGIKFDLYNDSGEGIDSTGFYTNGALPTVPAVDMTSSGVNLRSGDILHAHITYDGTTLTLTVTDTVTNASFTTSTAINIPATVGSNTAYVGFTASTGASTAVQNILNWTYLTN
jgi:hypothetical protein